MGGSGGGGSSSTSTKSGPPAWLTPTSQGLAGQLGQLYGSGQAYPGQQVAGFTPDQLAAMGGIEGLTGQQQQVLGDVQSANQAIAQGQNPYMQQAAGAAGGLLNDPSVQAAIQANQNIASGGMLDASKNQALQSYLQAGMDPIVANFQNAVAPNILSNAITSGGLGSSGTQQAFGQAESQLGKQLSDYSASVIEPAYQAERQLQQQAIGEAPALMQPREAGISALQGLTGLQQGAIGQAPGLSQAQYDPSQALLGIGGQQQQQGQNILGAQFGNQMMPYQMLGQAASLLGPLAGGGGQSFTIGSQPGGGSMK